MLIDAFTYFNEIEVLKLRLEILAGCVDKHVVVEATETFTGHDKPLFFDALPPWIQDWDDKIVRHVVHFPMGLSPWEREAYQRDSIAEAVAGFSPNDMVLISDCDEIPNPEVLDRTYSHPVQLDVKQYFWKLNWQVPQHCNQGARPVLTRLGDLTSPQAMRASVMERVPDGGWHFSFLESQAATRNKIEAFSHTEVNVEEFKTLEHLTRNAAMGIDPFDRFPLKHVDVDSSFPVWVRENMDSLGHLLVQGYAK
jgi:beta-1,4-mannosyl-glycoprotein beta-1,4-N-acetylglucosaminyltransferase